MCDRPHPCSRHPLRVDSQNMTTFFGPEMPQPLSARTEKHMAHLPIERDANAPDLYSFGPVYNARLNFEMAKMAEIDFDDRICYVGPCRGNNLRHLIAQLSVIHPVVHLVPGAALHEAGEAWAIEEAQENASLLHRSERSAEAFFREWRPEVGPHFDKIIVRDCYGLIQDLRDFYADVVITLTPKRGRLLLVHRPDSLSSLPFRTPAMMLDQKKAPSVSDVVEDLKAANCEVEYEVLRLPMLMSKNKWLSMLHHRYPAQLRDATDEQVSAGMRELVDGPFKYCGNSFECEDVLLFACASEPEAVTRARAARQFRTGYYSGRLQQAEKEMLKGLEARNCSSTNSSALRQRVVEGPERYPLVQKCKVIFHHDMQRIYRG